QRGSLERDRCLLAELAGAADAVGEFLGLDLEIERAGGVVIGGVDGAARKDPDVGHESGVASAPQHQHLEAAFAVPAAAAQQDHGGRGTGDGGLIHARHSTLGFRAPWARPRPSSSGSARPAGTSTTPPRAIPTAGFPPGPSSRRSPTTGSARSAARARRYSSRSTEPAAQASRARSRRRRLTRETTKAKIPPSS